MKLDRKALDEAYGIVAYRHTADKGVLAEAIRTYLTAIGETHVIVPRDGTLARAFVTARVEGHYQTAWTEVFVDAASLEALLPATNVRVAIPREPELAAVKEGE